MSDTPQAVSPPSDAPAGESMPLQRGPDERVCERQGCGEPLTGKQERWCSETCRWKVWDAKNPRQRPLDFAPSGWTPAQRELSAHMRKRESKKARMLVRLQRGEATTGELMAIGGSGWRSRLQELREDGHRVSCENRLDYAVYRLEVS